MEEKVPETNDSFLTSDIQSKPEFVWKNLVIGIAVVVVVIFFIYLGVSQSVKSSDYKSMDLSTKNQDSGSVAGASTYSPYGPPDQPAGSVVFPTKLPSSTATPAPTATPTSASSSSSNPTATPTLQPTATQTPTPTATPMPTPTNSPTPTATPAATPTP